MEEMTGKQTKAAVSTVATAAVAAALFYVGGVDAVMLPYKGLKHAVMGLKWPLTYLEKWGLLKLSWLKACALGLLTVSFYALVVYTLWCLYDLPK